MLECKAQTFISELLDEVRYLIYQYWIGTSLVLYKQNCLSFVTVFVDFTSFIWKRWSSWPSCARTCSSDISAIFSFLVRMWLFLTSAAELCISLGTSLAPVHVFNVPELSHQWFCFPSPPTSLMLPCLAFAFHVFNHCSRLVGILM